MGGVGHGTAWSKVPNIGYQAALRLGTWMAERSVGLLEGLTDQEDLDMVGDWILECGSGGETPVPRPQPAAGKAIMKLA